MVYGYHNLIDMILIERMVELWAFSGKGSGDMFVQRDIKSKCMLTLHRVIFIVSCKDCARSAGMKQFQSM